MNIDIKKILELVYSARPLIMNETMSHEITVKGLADFVTRVDTSVQHYLQDKLCKLYPKVQFMGEEDYMQNVDFSKPVWILDPIDGTTNLIYNYHHSAVSLGFYENGEIRAGIIYNPFSDETFHAIRGKGAYLNNQPIHVTDNKLLKDSLIAIGTSPYRKELAPANFKVFQEVYEKSLDIRRSGSAALDLAYVACGRLDGYFERDLKPWDFAAGALIVEEAGGQCNDFNLCKLDFSKNQDVLATNGHIQSELQNLLKFSN